MNCIGQTNQSGCVHTKFQMWPVAVKGHSKSSFSSERVIYAKQWSLIPDSFKTTSAAKLYFSHTPSLFTYIVCNDLHENQIKILKKDIGKLFSSF